MKLEVVATPVAKKHIRELGAWWRSNRTKAPTLFRDELRRVYELIAAQPYIGVSVDEPGIEGLRRYPIKKTPYLVYYVPDVASGLIYVEAVWSGMRGEGPPL